METTYRKLNLSKLSNRKRYVISSNEALKDVTPINWSNEVKNGNKKVNIMRLWWNWQTR